MYEVNVKICIEPVGNHESQQYLNEKFKLKRHAKEIELLPEKYFRKIIVHAQQTKAENGKEKYLRLSEQRWEVRLKRDLKDTKHRQEEKI